MITISRSAVVTRKTCEMKRYLNYHLRLTPDQGVGGIVPREEASIKSALPRLRGQILHATAEQIFLGTDWKAFLHEQCAQLDASIRTEQETLIRRVLLGWTVVRKEFVEDFTTVSSEAEWKWDMGHGVQQALRLDRVLRRKDDGTLAILDFKTMRAPDKNWIERMQNSEQTHLYIQALRERSTEWVLGMIYEGLIIGALDDDNHQKSPFVRAYQKKNGTLSPKYVPGAPTILTLDWSDAYWLAWMQEHQALNDLYCTTGPLLPPFAQLLSTKRSTAAAELRWYGKLSELQQDIDLYGAESEETLMSREALIEKNPDACLKYGWEYACPYHRVCWEGAIPDEETFEPREDHHA